MKFGKNLRETTQKEWIFYAVDYKDLKRTLKASGDDKPDTDLFFRLLDDSKRKLSKFYNDKEAWAFEYMKTLEERVASLREVCSAETSPTASSTGSISTSCSVSVFSNEDDNSDPPDLDRGLPESPGTLVEIDDAFAVLTKRQSFGTKQAWLKDEYRRMGSSKEFKAFIYAKKSLATFSRELALLLQFVELNKTAFFKILKKFDKRTGSSIQGETMAEIMYVLGFLDGLVLQKMKKHVDELIDKVNALKPQLPEGWENRKVYTIGCFDLFHRGHENVLLSLREFGYYVVAGIHDDASYYQLKQKNTIENLETRIAKVKPYVDQIFVIPSTDPLPYIRAMVSEQDLVTGKFQ